MKKIYLLFFFIIIGYSVNAQMSLWGVCPNVRVLNSKISSTGFLAEEDKFTTTYPTFTIVGLSDKAYFNFDLTGMMVGAMLKPAKSASYSSKWGSRFTKNNNRIANEVNIFAWDVCFFVNPKSKLKFGLGWSTKWTIEGVRLTDWAPGNLDTDKGPFGGTGLGSGVYLTKGRAYFGLLSSLSYSIGEEGRLRLLLTGTAGPYTGGGLAGTQLMAFYGITKGFGIKAGVGYYGKSFKEKTISDTNGPYILPKVTVKTLELNVGVFMHIDRK